MFDGGSNGQPSLIAKVALCLALLRESDPAVVSLADVRTASWIVRCLIRTTCDYMDLSAARKPVFRPEPARGGKGRFEPEIEDLVARIVRKLRKLGPCARRTLFRSYSSQDYRQLRPALDRAIELGQIEETDGILRISGEPAGICQRQPDGMSA